MLYGRVRTHIKAVQNCILLLCYVVFLCVVYRHMSPSDITAIQDALLRKCMDYGSRVVHIIVDKRSLFVSVVVIGVHAICNMYISIATGSNQSAHLGPTRVTLSLGQVDRNYPQIYNTL